jgi:hypothetical protein
MTFGLVSLLSSYPWTVYKMVRLYRPDMLIGEVIDFEKRVRLYSNWYSKDYFMGEIEVYDNWRTLENINSPTWLQTKMELPSR